jgi:hypothetical protein
VGSERGFVSVRLLVLLGLVVAAVWVLPLTLLQTEATHPTASAGPTAVGPTGTGEPLGATAGVVSPASDPVSDPIRKADDVQAQALLNEAIRAAQVYYAEHGSFDGFGPDAAAAYDPSIVYTQGGPASDMVSMTVSPTAVVLVTVVELNGGYLCAAEMGDTVTMGRTNATTPAECQGGWV